MELGLDLGLLIRRTLFAPRNFVEKLLEQVAQRDCRSWFAIGIERHGAIAFAINLPPDDLRRREAGTQRILSAFGTKQTSQRIRSMSAFGGKADILSAHLDVRS